MPAPKTLQSRLGLLLLLAIAIGVPAMMVYQFFRPAPPPEPPCYHDCYKTYDQMKADTANTGTAGRASTQAQ